MDGDTLLAERPRAGARAPGIPAAERASLLRRALEARILVLDGAMGTMIQAERLDEDG